MPLPIEPFRYYQYGKRTVHLDGCVEVDAAYYSAPPGWIGRRIPVQWDSRQVRLMNPDNGQLLREHFRQVRGRHRIKDEDRPKKMPPSTLDVCMANSKFHAAIGATDGPWRERLWRQKPAPLDRFVRMKLDSAS